MYLLNGNIEYYESPWPHIVINNVLPDDVADYMLRNFPTPGSSEKEQRQKKFLGCPDDLVFQEFAVENMSRQREFHTALNEIFKQPHEDLSNGRLSFKCSEPRESFQVLKKWHTDAADKKYKVLMYLGSGEGGWLELGNPLTKELKRYEYTHNRAVIYNNSELAFHQFYSASVNRYTIGFSVKFNDPTKLNYGNTFQHLQMSDSLW